MEVEKNYKRKSYRLKIPAKVIINNKEYEVLDWSFLGFRIKKGDLQIKKGEKIHLQFELPFAGFELRFNAVAVCRWCSDTEAGFEFLDLSDEIKLLMRQYVEAYIEGRLTSTEGMLTVAEGIELPVEVEPTLSEEEKKRLDKKLKRNLFIITLISIILVILGYTFYKNLPVVYSVEAFIAGTNMNILSPEEGQISKFYVNVGDTVYKGEPLFSVQNENIATEYKSLKNQLSLQKKFLKELTSQLKKLKNTNLLVGNIKQLEYMDKQINILKKQLNEKRYKLNKLKEAYQYYLVKKEEVDKLEDEIYYLKIKLLELEQKKFAVNNAIKTEIQKIKVSKQTAYINIVSKIQDIQNKIQEIESKLKLLNKKESSLTVYSPNRAYIVSIYKKEKELIKKYEPVMVLNLLDESPYVVARFKLQDAVKIKVGNKAEIYAPSLQKVYYGEVVAIGKQALTSESIVSETESYALKDVPVKIKINNYDDNLYTGLYVEARVITESRYIFIIDFISKLFGY